MRPFREGESLRNLIESAVPGFVSAEYPLFIEFVQCYLRFLEQSRVMETVTVAPEFGQTGAQTVQETTTLGGTVYETRKLLEYRDAATTLDEFSTHFLNMFAKNFPRYAHIPQDLLIRSLRDFYRSKGTSESIQWFFRVFFNEHADIYFPREDVLKSSDGSWKAPVTIKVSSPLIDPITGLTPTNAQVGEYYIGQRIQTTTGTALVEGVSTNIFGQAYNQNIIVNELTLKFDSILGSFSPGQEVVNLDSSITVRTRILPVVSSVTIRSGGSNYAPGDLVTFSEGPAGGYGYGAYGVVSSVASTSLNGVTINDGGNGYLIGESVSFTSSSGSGASAVVDEIVAGELLLDGEDGGFLLLETSTSDDPAPLTFEDRDTIALELTIAAFVGVGVNLLLNDSDYGLATGVPEMDGVTLDSAIEIALAASAEVPFMHPWVFTDAEETIPVLANASFVMSLTSGTFFEANTYIFALSNAQDVTTNLASASITANVIVSDIHTGGGQNTLYLDTITGYGSLALGGIYKQDGTGDVQSGTVVCNGTANVVGTNTTFTTLAANTHVRLSDGTHAVVKTVVNNTFLTLYTDAPTLAANTFAVIPTGSVANLTLQGQRTYGKIKRILLTSAGTNYATPPFVTVDSPSARAQEITYQAANGDFIAAAGQIDTYEQSSLTAEQSAGQVTKVKILGSGVNYTDVDGTQITVTHGDGRTGSDADIVPVLGALTHYPGYFTNTKGFLSSDKFLQDRNFYNDYTYVVRVAESFDRYKNILLKLMHPAGFKALGGFVEVLESPDVSLTAADPVMVNGSGAAL